MPSASKENNLEVPFAAAGKEDERAKYRHILADLINYCGNTLILLEIVVLVFVAVKLIIQIGGWLGVAFAFSLVPTSIMILLLTRLLKNEFLKKYSRSNMINNVSVQSSKKHTGTSMVKDADVNLSSDVFSEVGGEVCN